MKSQLQVLVMIISLSTSINAQGVFKEIKLDLKETKNQIQEAQFIDNEIDESVFGVFKEKRHTYGLWFDADFNVKKELSVKSVSSKYVQIIGEAKSLGKLTIVKADIIQDKFAITSFDFNKGLATEEKMELDLKNFVFIQAYSLKDKVHLYFIKKRGNTIKRADISVDGKVTFQEFDLGEHFKDKTLHDFLGGMGLGSAPSEMIKVDNRLPNALELTSQHYKMYEGEGSFIWSLDRYEHETLFLEFESPTKSPKIYSVDKANVKIKSPRTKTNSFLFKDYIAQIISNEKIMHLEIKNRNTFETLKVISVSKEENIDFSNTPIIQEYGSDFKENSKKEFDKTSRFLRKISSYKNGIAIFEKNGIYQLTMGGIQNVSNSLTNYSGGYGFNIATGAISYNPFAYSYYSYSSTSSTRIECLFDKNFNHIEGNVEDNIFDIIEGYSNRIPKKNAENVFYLKGEVFLGNFYPLTRNYTLYKFDNL